MDRIESGFVECVRPGHGAVETLVKELQRIIKEKGRVQHVKAHVVIVPEATGVGNAVPAGHWLSRKPNFQPRPVACEVW